jgi:hypothetical protein
MYMTDAWKSRSAAATRVNRSAAQAVGGTFVDRRSPTSPTLTRTLWFPSHPGGGGASRRSPRRSSIPAPAADAGQSRGRGRIVQQLRRRQGA